MVLVVESLRFAMSNPIPASWRLFRDQYEVHNAATPKDWDVSKARTLSKTGANPKAQYNPSKIPSGETRDNLEEYCIRKGIPLTDLSDPNVKVHKFYLDCREYYQDSDFVAGYCDGEFAHYILVKWNSHGGFHGQPATWSFLSQRHGA